MILEKYFCFKQDTKLKKIVMNMYKRALSGVLISGILLFASCNALTPMIESAKNGQSTVTPNPLELHGDKVEFTVKVQVPEKVLKPKIMYELDVFYKTATDEETAIGGENGTLVYDGDALATNPAPAVEKDLSFTYDEKYKEGQLAFKGRAYKKSKPEKVKETELYTIDNFGKGIITTSQLVQAPYSANYVPHGYDNSEKYIPTNVDFYFQQGRSDLRYSERRSDRGKDLEGYVSTNMPTRTINITGMHSPEGSTEINSKLANERAAVVEKYYKTLGKKFDYEATMDSINFVLKPVVEDWDSFKNAVQGSDKISDGQKSEVMDILNGSGDFVSKELKLQTLSFYRVLFRDIYPPLRAGKMEILQIKDEPTDAEIAVMTKKQANGEEIDGLNSKMMAYAASMTPDLAEKEKIYEGAIKLDDSYSAYNNLGATYMAMAIEESAADKKMDLVDKAISNFKLSIQKQESTEGKVNLASAQLIKGDVEGAKATMAGVSGGAGELGASVNSINGYFGITTADYGTAISNLEKAGNDPVAAYNKALAILLKASKEINADDYAKAKTAFADAISADPKNALAYYGAAITAARLANEGEVTSNLKKAFELDSSLKEKAVKDLEFLSQQSAVTEATK